MATTPFTTGESALGLITPETMRRFPAATYLLGKQAGSEAGLDVSDPRSVAKALQSRTAADRAAQAREAQSKQNSRVLTRLLGAAPPSYNIPLGGGTMDQNLMEGARVATDALGRTMKTRSLVGQEVMRENDRLAEFAKMDTAIDAREKKLKDKVLQGIERNILDVKNKALASRAMTRSQYGHLSPAQRNAILAQQGEVFTEQLSNLEALRSAREGAIDRRVADDRSSLELQIRGSEQRIKGLESAVKIMEQNGADASDIADIRVKLAQEREKLRKKGAGSVTRSDIVLDALMTQTKKKLGREPTDDEIKELKRQSELITRDPKLNAVVDNVSGPAQPLLNSPYTQPDDYYKSFQPGGSSMIKPDLGRALDFAGFGITRGREEVEDLQMQQIERIRKKKEYGLKLNPAEEAELQ